MKIDELDFSPFQQVPTSEYSQFLIKETLGLSSKILLNKNHVIQAVKKALMTPLRQTVGSCFATALAILIQQERPDLFLKDLEQILYLERLVRVVEGHECTVPISPFYHGGDPLLKVWEFTIATLSDYNHRAYRQNFHASLGLDPSDPEGIGRALWEHFERNFSDVKQFYNKTVSTIGDHENVLKNAQIRLNNAYREDDMRRIQAEIDVENLRLDGLELDAHDLKKKLTSVQEGATLFFEELELSLLNEFYEVYDPNILGDTAEVLNDTPAGFRLVWKNGLSLTTKHTRIEDIEGYLIAIKEFFAAFEQRLSVEMPQLTELIRSCGIIVSQHIHAPFFRKKIEKKQPWAYSSGGSLETMMEGYFEKKGPFQVEVNRPLAPLDLFVFYLDLMKSFSTDTMELFQKNEKKRLLALFPTHAFTLLPGEKVFREGWEDPGFSYTWIRDRLIDPSKKLYLQQPKTFATLEKELGRECAYQQFLGCFKGDLPRVIFADTNWESEQGKPFFFAFILDPNTLEIALFRTTLDGSEVVLMTQWNSLFNGEEIFAVFTLPFQYGGPYTAPRLWQKI